MFYKVFEIFLICSGTLFYLNICEFTLQILIVLLSQCILSFDKYLLISYYVFSVVRENNWKTEQQISKDVKMKRKYTLWAFIKCKCLIVADDDKRIIALLVREITKQDFIHEFCVSCLEIQISLLDASAVQNFLCPKLQSANVWT